MKRVSIIVDHHRRTATRSGRLLRSRLAIAVFGACLVPAVAGELYAADLQVTVDGIRSDAGKVMLALHAPRDDVDFPEDPGTVAAQWRMAKAGSAEFVFPGLPAGRYAVAVYHDENANDELDRNVLGIPTEGYAFSRDAQGFAGPPSFDEAAIEISEGAHATTATLIY